MCCLQVKQEMDELQEVYWKLQSSPLVTQLNTTFDEFVWASDMVRSRAFAIAKSEGKKLCRGTYVVLTCTSSANLSKVVTDVSLLSIVCPSESSHLVLGEILLKSGQLIDTMP